MQPRKFIAVHPDTHAAAKRLAKLADADAKTTFGLSQQRRSSIGDAVTAAVYGELRRREEKGRAKP